VRLIPACEWPGDLACARERARQREVEPESAPGDQGSAVGVELARDASLLVLARRLYAALEVKARAARIAALCCEVNLLPANLPSLAFHQRLGFATVGEATDPRNGKRVRYFLRKISS